MPHQYNIVVQNGSMSGFNISANSDHWAARHSMLKQKYAQQLEQQAQDSGFFRQNNRGAKVYDLEGHN